MNDDQHPGLDVDDPWQAVEACSAQEWTDGLPVVPPTVALAERMLAGGPWRADQVLLHEPVRDRAVTTWRAAINAVNLEKQGIPAVAVVTEPFAPTAAALAELHGMPGYPFVVVPHPFGSLDEAAVRSRADAALARIEQLLLGERAPR